MTLVPGDVIITGTPPGVGMARDPQLWMKPGDEVSIEIEGLGTLTNPVEAA
jgi:2-keto-4-pentenoate hydratase/2-oxohepta-3-ene-1,7-dioic acid hydratase in catechol pathway